MVIELKREPRNIQMAFACEASFKARLQAYAAHKGVTTSTVVYSILLLFLDGDLQKLELLSQELQGIGESELPE